MFGTSIYIYYYYEIYNNVVHYIEVELVELVGLGMIWSKFRIDWLNKCKGFAIRYKTVLIKFIIFLDVY